MLPRNKLLESAGYFIVAYLALLACSLEWGNAYVSTLLPLYRWELGQLAQDYRILGLTLGQQHDESIVSLSVLTQYAVAGARVVPPDIGISSSTLAGHALQHLLLMLSLAVAWPAASPKQRVLRLGWSLPFLLLLEVLDIPLVLMGSIQDLVYANYAPANTSLLVLWMNFLNGGGRFALAIAAALIALACGNLTKPSISTRQ